MLPVIEADAKKIGITFKVRTVKGAYPTLQTPSKNVPIAERPGWGKDYADAATFFTPLFDGRDIIPNGNTNYSLVGITPASAKTLKVDGQLHERAERRHALDKCEALVGAAAPDLLREPRQEADDEGRPVGPVPVVDRDPHHEHERHASTSSTSSARRRRTRTSR